MQVAENDSVVDSSAAKKWFGLIDRNNLDATLKSYPNFLHEIYNEAQREKAIGDFIAWLNERV